MFNRVSNKDFKGTPEIKKLWLVQFNNGFTGNEMEMAVKNLYHPLNDWHKKTGCRFATPKISINWRTNEWIFKLW